MNDADREMLPLLAGWLDGELTPGDAKRVEEALARSAELRAVLEEWSAVDAAMPREAPERPEAEWEALATRVDDAVAAEAAREREAVRREAAGPVDAGRRGGGWRSWFGTRAWAMGGGALVAATLALLLWPQQEKLLRDSETVGEMAARGDRPGPSATEADIPREEEEKEPGRVAEKGIVRETLTASPGAASSTVDELDADRVDGPALAAPPPASVPEAEAVDERTLEATMKKSEGERNAPAFRDVRLSRGSSESSYNILVLREGPEPIDLPRLDRELEAAVAEADEVALLRVLEELDRYGADPSGDDGIVAVLGLRIRARSEQIRLFAGAAGSDSACEKIRADYDEWRRLADPVVLESWEGLRIRESVREVCPG